MTEKNTIMEQDITTKQENTTSDPIASKEQNSTPSEQAKTIIVQTPKPPLLQKPDVLAALKDLIQYKDTNLKHREFASSQSYTHPTQFFRAIDTWILDPTSSVSVLCLRTPSEKLFPTWLLNIVAGMAKDLRDTRQHAHAAIITFGGGERPYTGTDGKHAGPLDRMRSLVCTVIAQLVDCLPDEIEDFGGELAEKMAAVRGKGEDWDICASMMVKEVVQMIKALVNVLPHKLFFVFEACDDLTKPDDELTARLAQLLCSLATPDNGRPARKIMWVGPGHSMPIMRVKLEVGHGCFKSVDHPDDWDW